MVIICPWHLWQIANRYRYKASGKLISSEYLPVADSLAFFVGLTSAPVPLFLSISEKPGERADISGRGDRPSPKNGPDTHEERERLA